MGITMSVIALVVVVVVVAIFYNQLTLVTHNLEAKLRTFIRYVRGNNYVMAQQNNGVVQENHAVVQENIGDQIQPPYQIPELPEWEMIEITQAEKQALQSLMEDEFITENIQKWRCPISKQFMREPITLNCCHNLFYCEKSVAQHWFNQGKTICPIPTCSQQSNINNITSQGLPIDAARDAIMNIRKRIRLTFQRQGLSDTFKQRINQAFGENYSEKHLQNN